MSSAKLSRPRFLQCLYAFTHNYFWIPCPMCGRKFGGHELSNNSVYSGGGSGYGVCRECGDKHADKIQKTNDTVWKSEEVAAIDGRKL